MTNNFKIGLSFLVGLGLLSVMVYGEHHAFSSQHDDDDAVSLESTLKHQKTAPESVSLRSDVEVSPQDLLAQEKAFAHNPSAITSQVKLLDPKHTWIGPGNSGEPFTETEVLLASPKQLSQGEASSIPGIAPMTVPNESIEMAIHEAIPGLMTCTSNASNNPISNSNGSTSSIHEFAMEQRYLYHTVDLDGDRREEMVVSLLGPMTCGTGGCTRLILQASGDPNASSGISYQMVSKVTLVNGPMVVSDRTTSGWNDLLVKVDGGGAQSGYRRLQFDGRAYPSNPSLESMVELGAEQQGTLLVMDELTAQNSAPALSAPPCDR